MPVAELWEEICCGYSFFSRTDSHEADPSHTGQKTPPNIDSPRFQLCFRFISTLNDKTSFDNPGCGI